MARTRGGNKRKPTEKSSQPKKRTKKNASTRAQQVTSTTLVHEAKLKAKISTKTVISERGFELNKKGHEHIKEIIKHHGWEKFTTQPTGSNPSVVEKFYAHMVENADSSEVMLDRVTIDRSPDAINTLLQIKAPRKDEFGAASANISNLTENDWNSIAERLCFRPAKWNESNTAIVYADLKFEAKVWYHFVLTRLIPGRNKSEVTKSRMLLLDHILQKKTINVGALIFDRMTHVAKGSSRGLYFPSIVTMLCQKSGLKCHITKKPTVALSEDRMNKIKKKHDNAAGKPPSEVTGPRPKASKIPNGVKLDMVLNNQSAILSYLVQSVKVLDYNMRLPQSEELKNLPEPPVLEAPEGNNTTVDEKDTELSEDEEEDAESEEESENDEDDEEESDGEEESGGEEDGEKVVSDEDSGSEAEE